MKTLYKLTYSDKVPSGEIWFLNFKNLKLKEKTMKRILVESPFAATGNAGAAMNKNYLSNCIYDSLSRGEAPFASHGFYTHYLKDTNSEERAQGMACGRAWAESADIVAFYVDHGMSPGMFVMLEWLLHYDEAPRIPKIEIRRLGKGAL